MEQLNRELQALAEREARAEKVEALLVGARAALEARRVRCEELLDQLERENADVRRLEGWSLRAIFHAILQDLESQLEAERQDLLKAQLRYEEALDAASALEQEIGRLEAERAELGDLAAERARLLAEKEAAIRRAAGPRASRLIDLTRDVAAARASLNELEEALAAGNRAEATVDQILTSLGRAQGWGTWDLVGGGVVSSVLKHSHIDQARKRVHQAQQELRRFRSELKDTEISEPAGVELSEFESFADLFIDNIVIDWIVQSKIHDSLAGARRTQDELGQVLRAVEAERDRAAAEVAALEARRTALIEGA